MDGMTMLSKLREDAWGKDAHVIILTNLSGNEKIAGAVEQNTYEYLVKSNWKIEDVVSNVRNVLEKYDTSSCPAKEAQEENRDEAEKGQ